jgi:hypothetical protein
MEVVFSLISVTETSASRDRPIMGGPLSVFDRLASACYARNLAEVGAVTRNSLRDEQTKVVNRLGTLGSTNQCLFIGCISCP